ncbi:hypothetical protein SEA_HORUS_53 [Gordonia phage Horus]|uniref:Uncharacterized protein n=1 Tax=Gordonia phage Horus TaxID=2301696 RepID=A0A385DZD0_9CAUD|nr:hypothetical protein HOT93_gp097 [Gordonia phage Horus]AXQ63905.1 hypothetical protein SEA_HORUS_53 [Gordonia phage Horus]
MSGDWEEASVSEVRRKYKNRDAVPDMIETWIGRGWRVRKQGHGFGLWPPNPGFRWAPPPAPFVRIDGTPRGDGTSQARRLDRDCRALETVIRELKKDRDQTDG